MLWMVAVAFVVGFYGLITENKSNLHTVAYVQSWTVYRSIPAAVAIATIALGLHWRRNGAAFFDEVGHWLLVALSVGMLSELFSSAIKAWTIDTSTIWLSYTHMISVGLEILFQTILFAILALSIADNAPWRRFCYAGVLFYSLSILNYGISTYRLYFFVKGYAELQKAWLVVAFCIWIFWLVQCALAVCEDRITQRTRHWSHWCGLFGWLLTTLGQVAFSIYFYLAFVQSR